MYFQIYGCEGWGDYASIGAHNGTTVALAATPPCEHEAFPWVGSGYFCVYVLMTTYLLRRILV